MPTFKHIPFPVDFSDCCVKLLLPLVKAMVQQHNARLSLMHVIQIPIGWYGGRIDAHMIMSDVPAMTKAAGIQLDSFFQGPEPSERTQKIVKQGDPGAQIAAYVEDSDVDLIMMPTHGYGKFRGFVLVP